MTTRKSSLAAILAACAIVGCGGGGDNGGGGNPGGNELGPATVSGAIQAFSGGVVVNGVTFRTAGAQLHTTNSQPITLSGEDHIRTFVDTGTVVTIRGTRDDDSNARATEIEFHDSVEGRIDDKGPHHIVVAGTTISTDDSTVFADRHGGRLTPDDFSIGERVEVSGHGDSRGGVRATSIRTSDDSPEVEQEVRGWILSIAGPIVQIGFSRNGPVAIVVDVSGVSPAPTLAAGDFVEVKTRGVLNSSGVQLATAIHREDRIGTAPGARLQVEGIVTAVDGAGGFTVAGQVVSVSATTIYVGGTADDVVPGVKVEAQGVVGGNGVLAASKVKLKPVVRIEANATSVDAAGQTVSVLGLTVKVSPSTDLRGISSLAQLSANSEIEVRGTPSRDGSAIDATRLELRGDRPADEARLRGVVTEKSATTLKLAGLTANLSSGTEYRSRTDAPMSAAAFLEAITPGTTVVRVRWRPYPASTTDAIDEAELEN